MKEYDVFIIGGGISGTAVLYVLSNYTNVDNIALVEKYDKLAQVNSRKNNNSQTLHFGDIETNYTLEKAKSVKDAANMVKNYLNRFDKKKEVYSKYHKMVLAVGKKETDELRQRYEDFKELFPKLKVIDRKEIEKLEPEVVKGRNPREEILALHSDEGYTVDFGKLSESFVANSKKKGIDIMLGKKVSSIKKSKNGYEIIIGNDVFRAKSVVVASGAHSLMFARSLGFGKNYAMIMISGNFYLANKRVNGKVYTMQLKKLPFAAVHADPEVKEDDKTRFGPTAKMLFMLERRNYNTVGEYFKSSGLSFKALPSFFSIISDRDRFNYMFKNNILYELPFVGKTLFTKQARKIIPSLKPSDLKKGKGYGGVRPQIVDINKKELMLGEAKITGENIIFNMTPSPGASTCLKNAENDVIKILEFLGKKYRLDRKKFEKDLVK